MHNSGPGKNAGVASKPMTEKNATSKPSGDGTPAKSAAGASPKPAPAKAAPASPPKKPAGDGTAVKQAAVKPSSPSAPASPTTPKSTAASSSAAVATPAAKTVGGDANATVTSKPAKKAPALAKTTANASPAPAAAKPAAPGIPTAPTGGPVTPAVKPKPAASAAERPDVKATSGGSGGSAAAPADNHVTEDARVVTPAGAAAAAAAAVAIAAVGGETVFTKVPSLAAATAPPVPTLATGPPSQATGSPLRSSSSLPTASTIAPEPALTASVPDAAPEVNPVVDRPLPSPREKAPAAAHTAPPPVTQIASEPAIDCITVKPAAPHSPIKGAPSLKVISAPSPLRTVSIGAASAVDGAPAAASCAREERSDAAVAKTQAAEGPAPPPRSRTGSTAWEASPISAEAEVVAALPEASAPVVRFEASVSSRSLFPQEAAREAEAMAATSPLQPSTPPPPPPMPAPSVTTATATAGLAAATAAPSVTAGCVVVMLEHNPGGPCPVELPLPALDPAESGAGGAWTCAADLMTAAMKALRAKYGAVQASPAVNAFFVEPAGSVAGGHPERRRWLPTFDALPQELLAAASSGGRANVILQGITCGEAVEPPAAGAAGRGPTVPPLFPLPGFAESVESGSVVAPPSRVTFLSESGSGSASPTPPMIATRGLLRGASRAGSGGGTAAAGPAGGRILGPGHRSVRIRLEENTVETLCVESACPSTTSQRSQVAGTRLPPLRNDSDCSRAGDANTGASPFRGRLGATRSSRRLLVPACDLAAESVASSDFDNSVRSPLAVAAAAAAVKRDPVQVLKHTESMGADLEARAGTAAAVATTTIRDAGGGEEGKNGRGDGGAGEAVATRSSPGRPAALSVVAAKGRASSTGMESAPPAAAGAVAPATARKSSLIVRSEADTASGEDLEAAFFPAPAAEWIDLMGAETTDCPEAPQTGGCLSCFSAGNKAAHQQQWRERLQEALKARDEAEVAAWVAFHCGRNGTRNQRELDAVLWLAVEARAPGLVKVLIRGGAHPDAPRPMGPLADAATRGTLGSVSVARPTSATRVKDSMVVSAPPAPPPPMAWWPGSAATATAALEGLTPLMRAAELASYAIVEVLLAAGANAIAVQPTTGWTAVHRAVLATTPSSTASAGRKLPPAITVGVSSGSSSGSAGTAAAGKVGGRGAAGAIAEQRGGGGGDDDAAASALQCLRLLVQRIGLQHAAALITADRYSDDLVRFAVRHGRSEALSWLLSAGLSPDGGASSADDDDDEPSCAFLAGRLGLTVEVWDTPPPPSQCALRDPARPMSWLLSPEERLFADRRRQLLMGAAAGGRVDVLAAVLDKPPPLDRLRRDELESAIGACRLAQPRNQRQVEEVLARKAHTYMSWERETLPALRRFDEPVIREWLIRDRPMPVEVDRALAALLSSERLGAPLWHDNAAASVQALLDAGADIEHEWDVDFASLPQVAAAAAMSGREIKTLRPLQAALLAPAPAVARQLLTAGADPRRRDAKGENALFFSVRTAVAATIIAHEYNYPDAIRMVRKQPSDVSCANSSGRSGAAAAAASEVASSECIDVLLATEHAAELLAGRNDDGLTPAVLAALADMRGIVEKLCAAGADPWATPVAAAQGAPAVPRELMPAAPLTGSGNRRSAPGSALLWSVGHEAARMGALSALELLLGGPSSAVGRKPPLAAVNSEQAAARRRDALVGAIRGGRVGAAKLALDADGLGGSLYEAELTAALALCKASALQSLPPPPGAVDVTAATGGAFGSDPPRYDALAAFLASRAHVYMSWEGEVLPAVRSANVGIVRRWIAYDKISAATATQALCALVDAAQQCNSSAATVGANVAAAAAAAAASTVPEGNSVADGVLSRLSSVAASCLTTPGKAVAEVAAELVKAGADVNFQQEPSAGGQSLLMQVASIGHLPLLEALLALGARVDAEDAAGMTAVDHAVLARARLADNGCLAALLAAYGSRRLNAHRNHSGDSALMLAVRAGDSAAVQLLMASGATPAAADASAPARTGSMSGAVAAGVAVGATVVAATGIGASGVGAVSRARSSHYSANGTAASTSDAANGVSTAAMVTATAVAAASGSDAAQNSGTTTSAPSGSVVLSGRSLGTFASGLARRGSALYLAARMDDKVMLQQMLRKASSDEGNLESCRQEVQLGALHGGRLALLEASLAIPELLKSLPGPAEGGGATALGGAAEVCARLSEQAAVRLAEAQGLVVELQAVAADAGAAEAVPLSADDVARLRKYLAAKTSTLGALKAAHSRMVEFYGLAKLHMEALEGALEAKKELVSNSIRDSSDAQVKLMAATTRLTASKDSVLRSVLARRDAQLGRVEGLLEKKLAGLAAAQRRAEAKVTSDVEGIIMDMRKLVGRRLKDIDAKKLQALGHLGALERKLDVVWGRRQRLLGSRPPAVRAALNQKMGALMQQLGTRREALNEAVAAAVAKMEGGQRRGTALVNMETLRAALARAQQDMARGACEAAAIAKAAVVGRAEELVRTDKHDQLLRIVGHMQAEVTRGSSSAAAASAKTLAALQQAYAVAMGDLERRVAKARARMQEHITLLVASHVDFCKTLALADDPSQAAAAAEALAALPDAQLNPDGPPPDVAMLLLGFDGAAALDEIEEVPQAVPKKGSGLKDGMAAEESMLSVLQRVATVEEMIEDMIQDMAAQVLHAFPADGICDTLTPSDLAPLLEPESEMSTAGLGIDRLRQDIAEIDFGLPNLDLEVGDLDLSALEDDVGGPGGMRAFGVGSAAMGMGMGAYNNYDEDVLDDGSAVPQGRYGNGGGGGGGYRNRVSSDEGDAEPGGRGRYHAADYGDRHEDDFALSYS